MLLLSDQVVQYIANVGSHLNFKLDYPSDAVAAICRWATLLGRLVKTERPVDRRG
jgi:hypothetical protein